MELTWTSSSSELGEPPRSISAEPSGEASSDRDLRAPPRENGSGADLDMMSDILLRRRMAAPGVARTFS
jgi:hypothetical protein